MSTHRKLLLVQLNAAQIDSAKTVNGPRKKITHAVVCGEYGHMFGTYKQCHEYYEIWKDVYSTLFDGSLETEEFEFEDFSNTEDLANILTSAEDHLRNEHLRRNIITPKQKAYLTHLIREYPKVAKILEVNSGRLESLSPAQASDYIDEFVSFRDGDVTIDELRSYSAKSRNTHKGGCLRKLGWAFVTVALLMLVAIMFGS